MFVLPLLPALGELRRKWDAEPLDVIQKHAGEVRYFAHGFRSYLEPLQQPLRRCVEGGSMGSGRLKNGEDYLLLGYDTGASLREVAKLKDSICRLVIAAGTDVTLPSGLNFLKEVYAAGSLVGGEGNTYRAILAEQAIHLEPNSRTMRWAHAGGYFRADRGCTLYGRVSSDREIVLQSGCTFQRLHAPRIVMGCACEMRRESTTPPVSARRPAELLLPRRLVDGDLEIRAGAAVEENIIARGDLRIGPGSTVHGSVKGNQSVVVEEGARIEGSLVSSGALRIGLRCQIGGPVLAERQIEIGAGSVCGTADAPTTVSSPIVQAMEGTLFFGSLWAREEGRVVTRK